MTPDELNRPSDDLHGRVSQALRDGKLARARRLLNQAWRDDVADLPLRFPVILLRVDEQQVLALVRRMKSGAPAPQLALDRQPDGTVGVKIAESEITLGCLSSRDAKALDGYDRAGEFYKPQLMQILNTKNRIETVAIELVRPELRICPSCGNRHASPYVNCAACRSLRKIGRAEVGHQEIAPVAFHEALDEFSAHTTDEQTLDDILPPGL